LQREFHIHSLVEIILENFPGCLNWQKRAQNSRHQERARVQDERGLQGVLEKNGTDNWAEDACRSSDGGGKSETSSTNRGWINLKQMRMKNEKKK